MSDSIALLERKLLGEYDLLEQGDKKKLAKAVTPDGHVMIGSSSYAVGFPWYEATVATGERYGLEHVAGGAAWDEIYGDCLVECLLCKAIGDGLINVREVRK